jgi:hypothetical protein
MLEFAFDGVVEGTYATVESIGWQEMGLFKHMYWRVVWNGGRDKKCESGVGERWVSSGANQKPYQRRPRFLSLRE